MLFSHSSNSSTEYRLERLSIGVSCRRVGNASSLGGVTRVLGDAQSLQSGCLRSIARRSATNAS